MFDAQASVCRVTYQSFWPKYAIAMLVSIVVAAVVVVTASMAAVFIVLMALPILLILLRMVIAIPIGAHAIAVSVTSGQR